MREMDLKYMIDYYDNTLRFKKSGKNQYTVINKQNSEVGVTTGQSRYWYLRCFDLLKYHQKQKEEK